MRAIILASGVGSRMGQMGKQMPKCLMEINKTAIIKKQVFSLRANGINDINVVVGYKEEMVKKATKSLDLNYYFNPRYKDGGMLESIFAAKEKIDGELILIYGDVFFEPSAIKKLLQDKNDFCLAVDGSKEIDSAKEDKFEEYYGQKTRKGSTKVMLQGGFVKDISKDRIEGGINAEYIGIMKFSERGSQLLRDKIRQLIKSGEVIKFPSPSYLLKYFIENGERIGAVFADKKEYVEIDYEEDLKEARQRFQSGIKGIIFDAEDIIYYRDEETLAPIVDFLRNKKSNITAAMFKEAYEKDKLGLYKNKISKDEHLKRVLKHLGLARDKDFFETFADLFRKNYSDIKLNEKIRPLFKRLKDKNIKIGILTDTLSSADKKREQLKKFWLEQFVDALVCSSETGFTKDQKESFETMLKKLGLNSNEVIFVGHQKYEIEGAERAGVKSLPLLDLNAKIC